MNFDPSVRKYLFTNDWSSIRDNINDFDTIKEFIHSEDEDNNLVPLIEILKNKKLLNNEISKYEVENERFESIISFPNFLLQINAVLNNLEEEDSTLDDKHFLNNLSWAWGDADKAKNFLF